MKLANLPNVFNRVLIQLCVYAVTTEAANKSDFQQLAIERSNTDWRTNHYEINDGGNLMRGTINWSLKDNYDVNRTHNLSLAPGSCQYIKFVESTYNPWDSLGISQSSILWQRGPLFRYVDNSARAAGYSSMKSRGSTLTNAAVATADEIGSYGFGGYDGANWTNTSRIVGIAEATPASVGIATGIGFVMGTNNTAQKQQVYITSQGVACFSNSVIHYGSHDFITNTVATGNGTITMDMAKPYALLATNAPCTINLANVPTSGYREAILILSNSAASGAIMHTLSGFSAMTNLNSGPFNPSANIYSTNLSSKNQVGHLKVQCYGGILTNATWTPFWNP